MSYHDELALIGRAMSSDNPDVTALVPVLINLTQYDWELRKTALEEVQRHLGE